MKLFEVYKLFNIQPLRGKGCYVYDEHNNEYLDCYGGHAVISIGHSHPHFIKRITEQLKKLAFYSNSVKNDLQINFAKLLGEISDCEDYQLFLCNSGAEANENALKLASFHNRRTKIIAFKNAFHGRTSAAVNITDNPKIQAPINQQYPKVFLNLNDIESLEKELSQGDVCAVIFEGIQGIGGIHIPDPDFLQQVSALCQKHNTLLIADEIQSGYGRSGKFFAFQHAGITPDMITIAKGMGNGFPIGGVLIHPKLKAKYGMLGSTFGGNHLACAAGLAVLEIIQSENLINHAATTGDYLIQLLNKLEPFTAIRGKGLMIGMQANAPIAPLRKHLLFKEKLFTGSSADPNVIRILPPLNIQKEDIDVCIKKIQSGIAVFEPHFSEPHNQVSS